MDNAERAAYDRYMAEGIGELRRLWAEPGALAELVTENPAVTVENPGGGFVAELLPWAAVAGVGYVGWKSGLLTSLSTAIGGHVSAVTSGSGAAAPSGAANSACPAGSYRRKDGRVVSLADEKTGLQGAGYGGPWDTASMVAAYSRADPAGNGALTAC